MGLAQELQAQGSGPGEPPDDPGNPTVNFHGERRSNATHQSSTDPEAKLARKGPGKEAKLCYSANALMENRNTILIDFQVELADGHAERRAAIAMADERLPGSRRITLGGDRGYATRDFVASCRALKITPHVAQNQARPGGSALDARTARHPGYAVSQWLRKRVEEGVRLDEDGRRSAPHSLPRMQAGADACLPGSRRLQPDQNRATRPGSRMKRVAAYSLQPKPRLKTAAQHR